MTSSQYEAEKRLLDLECAKIVEAKRASYTGASEDVLHNFKDVAKQMGVTPMQAWGIYFLKHVSAITSFAKAAIETPGEPMIGRFADAKNYLDLGFAIMREASL